jgi:hypothetical protein
VDVDKLLNCEQQRSPVGICELNCTSKDVAKTWGQKWDGPECDREVIIFTQYEVKLTFLFIQLWFTQYSVPDYLRNKSKQLFSKKRIVAAHFDSETV